VGAGPTNGTAGPALWSHRDHGVAHIVPSAFENFDVLSINVPTVLEAQGRPGLRQQFHNAEQPIEVIHY